MHYFFLAGFLVISGGVLSIFEPTATALEITACYGCGLLTAILGAIRVTLD